MFTLNHDVPWYACVNVVQLTSQWFEWTDCDFSEFSVRHMRDIKTSNRSWLKHMSLASIHNRPLDCTMCRGIQHTTTCHMLQDAIHDLGDPIHGVSFLGRMFHSAARYFVSSTKLSLIRQHLTDQTERNFGLDWLKLVQLSTEIWTHETVRHKFLTLASCTWLTACLVFSTLEIFQREF